MPCTFTGWPGAEVRSRAHAAFQTSTITALLDGRYEGDVSIGELRRHGDLGLGTFNSLDGELVALDGEFWRADEAGALHRAGDDLLTPFAAVTRFAADETVPIGSPLALPGLIELLRDHLPASGCVAVRLDGTLQPGARPLGRPSATPYRPLAEVAERQHEFDLAGIEGSLVGFVFPSVAGALNVPGHHLHVATADRAAGRARARCRCGAGHAHGRPAGGRAPGAPAGRGAARGQVDSEILETGRRAALGAAERPVAVHAIRTRAP